MAVNPATVREMATLARLAVPEDQIEALAGEMGRILNFMGDIARFEGGKPEDGPPTARRPDQPTPTSCEGLMPTKYVDDAGAMTVPPIKGAS